MKFFHVFSHRQIKTIIHLRNINLLFFYMIVNWKLAGGESTTSYYFPRGRVQIDRTETSLPPIMSIEHRLNRSVSLKTQYSWTKSYKIRKHHGRSQAPCVFIRILGISKSVKNTKEYQMSSSPKIQVILPGNVTIEKEDWKL